MKILVTGGAGFIGSNVVDALVEQNHRVVIVDDLSSGFQRNVNLKAKFYPYDIRSKGLKKVFSKERPDVVIHHAAQINLRASVEHPEFDADVNILGSLNVFQTAVRFGVKKIIFSSTGGALYGDHAPVPSPESVLTQPESPYGVGKLAAEGYLRYNASQSSLQWVVLRYANVYGPRQNAHGEAGVVAIFTQQLLEGKRPVINGKGNQTRDFVYVDDVVAANLLALESKKSGTYNIGTGVETDVNHIFEVIRKAVGSSMSAQHGPAKKGEQMRSCLDSRLAIKALGWKPKISLEEGIQKTVGWFKKKV